MSHVNFLSAQTEISHILLSACGLALLLVELMGGIPQLDL